MRLGLIADIHGSLLAFEQVLAELERERIDRVICLGDVAVGPQPVECLDKLQALGCPTVMGNWDACMLGTEPHVDGELAELLVDACTWSTEQISSEHKELLRSFKDTIEVRLDEDATLLAFHGSPRSFNEEIYATTPDDEVENMLDGYDAVIYAGAHTHFQMLRRFGDGVIVNVGSVGQRFQRRQAGIMRLSPWADYCLLEYEDGNLVVELRRTRLDVNALTNAVRTSGMPDADRWADLWLPEPTPVS